MRSYRVAWEIDVEAESPVDAARGALAAQRRPGSTATVFAVEWTDTMGDELGTECTSRVSVDLEDIPVPE
jgi:hypothetical protein